MTDTKKNQGEGNRTADRRYRKDTAEFLESEDVTKHAKEAEKALSGKEGKALREAERKGKARAKAEDV